MGKEMGKCCEGLPSAILEFIGFMARKHSLEEWVEVHKNLQSFVRRSLDLGATLQRLALSYDNLPHFQRPCFLYLGYLQENSRIEAEKLYLLWLAEGFISLEDNGKDETLLNAAERYLDDLEQRSMIEVHEEEVPTVTRLNSCRLSELMRELSLAKGKDDEFFKVVDFGCGMQQATGSSSSCRLSINLDKYEHKYVFKVKTDEEEKMRCLLIYAKENQKELVWPQSLSSLVKFQSLRVLDFMGIPFQETKLPKGIGLLVHLRYLSFKGCNLPKLPSSVGKLKFLYVLDLRVTKKMIIPDVLWKLKKLKHLYFPSTFETDGAPKLRLDGLLELETVTNLDVNMCNVSDLLHCYNLRYLALSVTESLEEIERVVERMNMNSGVHFLRTSLEVREFDCYTEERISVLRQLIGCQSLIVLCLGGHIGRLPLHDEISSNLAKIVLIRSELMEDPMTTLEKLPNLRVLELDVDAFKGKEMTCSASGFTELRRLKLSNLRYLEKWIVKDGAMLRLSTLTIVNCEKLIMLPEELQFVHHLQQMTVSGMHQKFNDSIRMVKGMVENQHVPSITIEN
ncbi:UNVERIFIED_CONTAM: Disease resistance protein RPP8 [Sesamum indicum]